MSIPPCDPCDSISGDLSARLRAWLQSCAKDVTPKNASASGEVSNVGNAESMPPDVSDFLDAAWSG